MSRLPPKFKKELLLSMHKARLTTCPIFIGLDDRIITRLALTMRPYLACLGDQIIHEGDAGDGRSRACSRATCACLSRLPRNTKKLALMHGWRAEMYIVVKGDVKVTSSKYPKFNAKSWVDGAFFGELPLLGLGTGRFRNLHIYSVQAMVETELSFLSKRAMLRVSPKCLLSANLAGFDWF